jgi:hypothetical protein
MDDISIAFVLLALAAIATTLVISRRRNRRDLREYLEPELRQCGVEFVSAVYPGAFKVGPFPKFEVQVGRPQSQAAGVSGEYSSYRIVTIRDAEGTLHKIWALVEFEQFKFRRVRWRTERTDDLPPSVLSLLET